ncbi:MAG: histidine kinase [Verrucomicrobia bacterium]|nr:histidine kinase [Verrucomicrobiota bacterium]
MAGLLAASVLAAERAKTRRQIQRLQTQQALEKERRRIAQDIHDDIGGSLSGLTMLGEMAGRKSLSLAETRSQLAVMTTKVRELARAMDEIIWAVNPRNDTLPSLVSYLQHFASEYLDPTPIRARMDVPAGLPPVLLHAQARHSLFLAVKEAIHNAAAHSGAAEIWIRVQWATPVLTISVEDNGRGFEPARSSGARNGLTNMPTRLRDIGGACAVESQLGQGCRVRFTLPLTGVVAGDGAEITSSGDGRTSD